MPIQDDMPPEYARIDPDELQARVARRKEEMGRSLVILGHHYQRDEIVRFADFTGDSLELSRLAAEQTDARYIVFCGVHFMAESADILSGAEQAVCLPNLRAGCAMADMAPDAAVGAAFDELTGATSARIVPVTYVNSTAAIKARTADAGGACCTSSNARSVFRWALTPGERGGAGAEKVFAIPDQHLGRNTAVAMGCREQDCALYDPALPLGGLSPEQIDRATFLLWKGHCYVHQFFTAEHIRQVRRRDPAIRVIVHPECPRQVVAVADASGSTAQIIEAVRQSPPGSRWAIGTEANLVHRLARQYRDRHVELLGSGRALCVQMAEIDLPHLLWVLDELAEGRVVNRICVPEDVADRARKALERMIRLRGSRQAAPTRQGGR